MKKRMTLKRLLFEQQILGILLFTLLVVFLWVISGIYFSYSTTTLTAEDQINVLPLDASIDEKPLSILNRRKWWTPQELESFPIQVVLKDADGKVIRSNASPTASSSTTLQQ